MLYDTFGMNLTENGSRYVSERRKQLGDDFQHFQSVSSLGSRPSAHPGLTPGSSLVSPRILPPTDPSIIGDIKLIFGIIAFGMTPA